MPNLDSPKHNFRQSFKPILARIPNCGREINEINNYLILKEKEEKDEAEGGDYDDNKQKKIPKLFKFINYNNRRKFRYA